MSQTIDDVSTGVAEDPAEPGVVLVARGRVAARDVFAVPAELGRRIVAGRRTRDVDDERMSRDHAIVRRDRGGWVIVDRESRNGTFVDGERITGQVRRTGDVVLRLGHTVFVLVEDARGHDSADEPADQIVGPELARVFADIDRAVAGDTLLVHGESGSGKELAARRYHERGPRRSGPFVAVNCATIPEGVAERLLFGARKGAFSGAIDAPGHFQMASGGTLFLDEIAELDAAVQAKLLRVLETREVLPVGASASTRVDVGIVAASHRELRTAVAERRFRDDLYYRLAQVTVYLPPLRDRKVDIARFVQRELAASGDVAAHAKLIELCCTRPWPGNVRELRAAIRDAARKAVAAGRDLVRVEDLAPTAGMAFAAPEAPAAPAGNPRELDRPTIEAALAAANGVVSVAARTLGLHRTQLYRLMDKLGIARVDT